MPGSAVANGDAGLSWTTRAAAKTRAAEEELEGMSVPHVEEYLEATMNAPNPLLQPCALRNFQRNSYSIASCMKFRCCETEQELIEDLMTVNEPVLWDYICNAISAEKADSHFTADQVTEQIHLTMQLMKGSVSTTLVAMTNTGIKQKITTCTNCRKRGHHMESCISAGGGMVGKTITEAQAAMGKKKWKVDPLQANIATSAAPPAPPASANSRAYLGCQWITSIPHKLACAINASHTLALAPMVNQNANLYGNFAGFTSNSLDEAYTIPAPTSHHAWIAISGPLTTLLDWALQSCQVAADAMTAAIVEHSPTIKRWIFTRHPGGLTVVHQPTSPRKGVISSNFTQLSPVVFKVLVDHPYLLWG
ncbi:hypothetical protein IMY05_C4441000100 [Salix suchowensis]|nr:hypothetical protein IMY05_C4441000100 [Salix suchowensis]